MITGKKFALTVLLLVGVAGLALGLARDFYSVERSVVSGTIVSVSPAVERTKAPSNSTPDLEVKLANGQVIGVATTDTAGLVSGQNIEIIEMVMPWGQIWYRRR